MSRPAGVIGYVQEAKAQNAVAALARMTAATAGVLRDGRPQRVPSAELVRGDVLVLAEGDAVGAVARIGRTLGLAVVAIAVVVVGTILLISGIRNTADVVHMLLLGVSLAVAAVPEGLPAILAPDSGPALAMGVDLPPTT